mmetsp:Transcript_4823/g.12121  ORF Transcript_4823/g.12121 Transcript_4823/m.12121 type:complete len:432 (-) Transcript_4823:266-1561(-)
MAEAIATKFLSQPTPPPGLGDALANIMMMTAKIPHPASSKQHADTSGSDEAASAGAAWGACLEDGECTTQGEWVNAVMATAPFLDSQGLQEALSILDCALHNVHQLQTWDGFLASLHANTFAWVAPDQFVYAEYMRLQILNEQQVLLQHLHNLRAAAIVAATAAFVVGTENLGKDAGDAKIGRATRGEVPRKDVTDLVLGALGHPQQHVSAAAAATGALGCDQKATVLGGNRPRQPAAKGGAVDGTPVEKSTNKQVQTLSTSLQVLANEDPDCLFIVRRINKLGFKACRKLKQHFSKYGSVARVLVAHSTVRQHHDVFANTRRRPSSLGFVHMTSASAVCAILASGPEQEVDGSFIRVQQFERHPDEEVIAEGVEGEEAEASDETQKSDSNKAQGWERQESPFSTASTRTAASIAASLESETAGVEVVPSF